MRLRYSLNKINNTIYRKVDISKVKLRLYVTPWKSDYIIYCNFHPDESICSKSYIL